MSLERPLNGCENNYVSLASEKKTARDNANLNGKEREREGGRANAKANERR